MTFATIHDRYSDEEIEHFYATGQWTQDTLWSLLDAQAEANPEKLFITDDRRSMTYRLLRDESLRLAAGLGQAGIGAGDRVSVQIPNWIEFAPIAVALARVGAIMVPIMPIYRRDEVGYILKNAGVVMAITCETFKRFGYTDMYEELRPDLPELRSIVVVRSAQGSVCARSVAYEDLVLTVDPNALPPATGGTGPDDHFVIVYSSGTTARPKGCLHTFNTMACGSRLLARGFAYTPEDVQFGPSPVTHTTGLVTSVILPMMHGAVSHIMESWEPRLGLEQIAEHRCTVAVTAATFLHMLLGAYDPREHDASTLRLWVAAGSPISAALIERAAASLPKLTVLSLYGRTENITTTMCTVEDGPERSITSDGSVLPMQSVRIVDLDGKEVPRGEEGDIAYKGAMHMLEYIGNPEETAKMFTDGGYSRSGDLGIMDEDGYVRVTGRLKDIVIRGGLNISVRQVEDLLAAHPAVDAVAVVGMPDERLGERICCYIVPTPGQEDVTLDDLTDYLKDQGLAIQKMPERLEILSQMPMTATGKIQKHVLREDIKAKVG